jgi:hypothetical protein
MFDISSGVFELRCIFLCGFVANIPDGDLCLTLVVDQEAIPVQSFYHVKGPPRII